MISKNIKAVVFDLDNTLYEESKYFEAVLQAFLKKGNFKQLSEIPAVNIKDRFETDDYLGFLLKKMNIYSYKNQNEFFNLYCNFYKKIELDSLVVECIKKLKKLSIKLGILTNGVPEAQRNKIRCLNLESYIDNIIYARDFGVEYEKPNALPFRHIANEIGVDESRIVFVGDHPINDIQGAHDAGMQTAWLENAFFPKPMLADIVIKNLKQLIGEIENES